MGPINLYDYEALARQRLPQMVYDYYVGGAGDERTVQENQRVWGRVRLRPRMLVDVSERDLSTTILGQPISMPVLTAPAAFHAMAHPDGECAVARAAAAAGIIHHQCGKHPLHLQPGRAMHSGLPIFIQWLCSRVSHLVSA